MRSIQASEAKAKFASLLNEVEQGETVLITRHGKCVARLMPGEQEVRQRRNEAFAKLAEIGRSIKQRGGSFEEMMASRDEGRK